MILYSYSCDTCHRRREPTFVEYHRAVAERDTATCPVCGDYLHRLLTVPAIRGATVSRA